MIFFAEKKYCEKCESVSPIKEKTPGSIMLELVLWLMILPGVIYSFWRIGARKEICGSCGHEGPLPLNSPKVQRLLGTQATVEAVDSNKVWKRPHG